MGFFTVWARGQALKSGVRPQACDMMDRQLSGRDLFPGHLEWDPSSHATTISSDGAPLVHLGWNDALRNEIAIPEGSGRWFASSGHKLVRQPRNSVLTGRWVGQREAVLRPFEEMFPTMLTPFAGREPAVNRSPPGLSRVPCTSSSAVEHDQGDRNGFNAAWPALAQQAHSALRAPLRSVAKCILLSCAACSGLDTTADVTQMLKRLYGKALIAAGVSSVLIDRPPSSIEAVFQPLSSTARVPSTSDFSLVHRRWKSDSRTTGAGREKGVLCSTNDATVARHLEPITLHVDHDASGRSRGARDARENKGVMFWKQLRRPIPGQGARARWAGLRFNRSGFTARDSPQREAEKAVTVFLSPRCGRRRHPLLRPELW
ncbi:hypothetical protein B0J18DRAFT_407214 [Chaetomium sp. MPI-SDFR-AT-0129]|nr:hypothetical protein B0J18DRAFT_407214 [Chaetomium sp. MPI-SDFR-AT-0129]